MIKQVKVLDPNLVSEEQEIGNYLMNHELNYKMIRIMHGSYQDSQQDSQRRKNGSKVKYKTKDVSELLEMENLKIKIKNEQ
jgi:hypothetical protein